MRDVYEAVLKYLEDWGRCIELDPFQHISSFLVGVGCTLLLAVFWASVKALL